MKLSVWAKQKGISYQTAWRWVKSGKMPVKFERMPTGTIIVYDEEKVKRESEDRYGKKEND